MKLDPGMCGCDCPDIRHLRLLTLDGELGVTVAVAAELSGEHDAKVNLGSVFPSSGSKSSTVRFTAPI